MTPYELRFEIFKQAYAHANDEYVAGYNIVDNHNQDQNTEIDKWNYPPFPSYEKIENFQFMMEDYVDHLDLHFKQILGVLDFPKKKKNRQVRVEEAMQHLGGDTRFATVLEHGTMIVEIYQPIENDPQSPHAQDELYVIISGSGDFYNDGVTTPFQTGDVLFVPAGVEHRFENFSDDFMTWVFFYGPEGGEDYSE